MKYLDKVTAVNADGENYEKGFRIEITNSELSLIYKALDLAEELEDNEVYKEHQKLMEKFEKLFSVSGKEIKNIDLD